MSLYVMLIFGLAYIIFLDNRFCIGPTMHASVFFLHDTFSCTLDHVVLLKLLQLYSLILAGCVEMYWDVM